MKDIDICAFSGCTSLESISLPVALTEISGAMFSGCSNLKKVYIPKSVKKIVREAFHYCSSLAEVNYGGSLDDLSIGTENDVLQSETVKFNTNVKNTNSMTASGKTTKVKYKKLKKKKFKKYFKINVSNGTVTIKKKLRKGTYKVKCTINAAGTEDYKPVTKTVTFKIKVK